MDVRGRFRRGYVLAWLLLIAALILPAVVRTALRAPGPAVEIVRLDGDGHVVSLGEMKRLQAISRRGEYQNQYGNWRDEGTYTGVRLTDLIEADADYEVLRIVAEDGYEIVIGRRRVEDSDYPVVLAYAFNGIEIPAWEDGPRIAVLPEKGRVSNEDYGTDSAGSYWVKNVDRIVLQ